MSLTDERREDVTVSVKVTVRRGTSNGNARGSSADRAARRAWLLTTYRADVDVLANEDGEIVSVVPVGSITVDTYVGSWTRACRCYRCGALLTENTVTVDRIVPGCQGGTYRRNNIRPACSKCNSETGGRLSGKGKR